MKQLKGVEEMSDEFQQFVDEEVKKAEERAEQRAKQWAEQRAEQMIDESTIAYIRSLTEKKHFTVQEAMDALSIPADKQDVYAQMV